MMSNTTLKRAAGYASDLMEASKKITVSPTLGVSVNSHAAQSAENFKDAVIKHTSGLSTDIESVLSLINAQFALRALIDEANHKSGLSKLIGEQAKHQALVKRYVELQEIMSTSQSSVSDVPEAMRDFETIKSASASGTTRFLSTTVLFDCSSSAKEMLTEQLKVAKRHLANLKDDIASLNLRTTIDVPDHVVEQLQKIGAV